MHVRRERAAARARVVAIVRAAQAEEQAASSASCRMAIGEVAKS